MSGLKCQECGCVSAEGARWIGLVAYDPEESHDDTVVAVYCPACATREFERPMAAPYM